MRPRPSVHAPALACTLALSLVALVGCGGGAKSSAPSPTTAVPAAAAGGGGGGGGNRAALAAFRDCMAKHGSPLPTFAPRANNGNPPSSLPDDGAGGGGAGRRGGFGGGGIGNADTSTDPAVRAAFAACQSTLPPGFLQQQQQAQQQRTAFNSCMKDHGVTLPSGPAPAGATPGDTTTTTIDRNSPAYTAAFAVCGPLLPQRPNGTTTTTTVAQ